MSKLIKQNEAVFRSKDDVLVLSNNDISILSSSVKTTEKKRNRICCHENDSSLVHEMHICLDKSTYIRPAKHLNKSESLNVLEGNALLYFFDDHGKITSINKLGNYESGDAFFYRMNTAVYHTLIVLSDFFIFHEVTKGPFKIEDTIMAKWSPLESDMVKAKKFLNQLIKCKVGDKVTY